MNTTLLLILTMANASQEATEAPRPDLHIILAEPVPTLRSIMPEGRIEALELEVASLKTEVRAARERADRAYDLAQNAGRYRNGVGVGALMPLKAGRTQFGMNANLHWLTAQWVPSAGVGIGISPGIEVWRLRLRVFDLGVFYDYGTPLTVPDIGRKVDLTLASGLDVRVWKGLALHGQVGWFLPNPVSLYDAATARYDASKTSESPDIGNAKSAGQYALNRFGDAFKSPMVTLALNWQF